MAAPMNNIDGKKTDQLIELMKAELNKVKAGLKDELDKVNADAEKLRALNVSRSVLSWPERKAQSTGRGEISAGEDCTQHEWCAVPGVGEGTTASKLLKTDCRLIRRPRHGAHLGDEVAKAITSLEAALCCPAIGRGARENFVIS